MPERAHVRSIDAIAAFRAGLLTCVEEVRAALTEVTDDVSRCRQWLLSNRLPYWQGEVRRRQSALEDAKQALRSARMSGLRTTHGWESSQVTRQRRELEEAEQKLRVVKRWCREYDDHVGPRVQPLIGFSEWIARDMALALGSLHETVVTLEAYTRDRPPPAADPIVTRAPGPDGVGDAGLEVR